MSVMGTGLQVTCVFYLSHPYCENIKDTSYILRHTDMRAYAHACTHTYISLGLGAKVIWAVLSWQTTASFSGVPYVIELSSQ